MTDVRRTYAWQKLRKQRLLTASLRKEPCALCGKPIRYDLDGNQPTGPTIDHTHPIGRGGEELPSLDQLRPAHRRCNNRQGARIKNATSKTQRRTKIKDVSLSEVSRPAPRSGAVPPGVSRVWSGRVPDWLDDLSVVPGNGSAPLVVSDPHPLAVGSYGGLVESWLWERSRVRLRWWQALAVRLQLQHDRAGNLVVREVVESGPRRIGKSTRLRGVALWRIGWDGWDEDQLVLMTGKDLKIAKEIHSKGYKLADELGWPVRKQNGSEEITAGFNRWLVRGQDSVYGYDINMAQVDESWAVSPSVVDDGLEPALLEREGPQLHLTSTAHRRATSLMLDRMSPEDPDRLVLWWGAPAGVELSDEVGWRLASPHWSDDRLNMMRRVYRRALEGHTLDKDEPDPMEAFKAQYLCQWPARADVLRWLPRWVTDAATVDEVADPPRDAVCAVEVAYETGLHSAGRWAVVFAWPVGNTVVARAVRCASVAEALRVAGDDRRILAHDAVLEQMTAEGRTTRVEKVGASQTRAATETLAERARQQLVTVAGVADWEWAAVRTTSRDGGEFIDAPKSLGDVAAVKALSWAVWHVEAARHTGPVLVA